MCPIRPADPFIIAKMELVAQALAIHNGAEHDDRPFHIHITAHREGERPRNIGEITVRDGAMGFADMIAATETEMALSGVILGTYGILLVRSAAIAAAIRANRIRNGASCPQSETDV